MEFRYLSLIAGEFGSKETDIAKSVKTRQQALADKLAGRPVSGLSLSWTQLVAPHLAPKDPKIDKPYCCTQGWFSDNCWSSPKDPHAEEQEVAPLVKNEFTDEERLVMWQRLWGPTPKGESKEENARKRAALRRYMVHMALSNTVKPYEDQGIMKFQAESAEELAMATFSRKCGFFKKQINPTVLEITEYDENLKVRGTHNSAANRFMKALRRDFPLLLLTLCSLWVLSSVCSFLSCSGEASEGDRDLQSRCDVRFHFEARPRHRGVPACGWRQEMSRHDEGTGYGGSAVDCLG